MLAALQDSWQLYQESMSHISLNNISIVDTSPCRCWNFPYVGMWQYSLLNELQAPYPQWICGLASNKNGVTARQPKTMLRAVTTIMTVQRTSISDHYNVTIGTVTNMSLSTQAGLFFRKVAHSWCHVFSRVFQTDSKEYIRVGHNNLAHALRPSMIYCASTFWLTLHQSYTSNEM
jgi:hypothetical protein